MIKTKNIQKFPFLKGGNILKEVKSPYMISSKFVI